MDSDRRRGGAVAILSEKDLERLGFSEALFLYNQLKEAKMPKWNVELIFQWPGGRISAVFDRGLEARDADSAIEECFYLNSQHLTSDGVPRLVGAASWTDDAGVGDFPLTTSRLRRQSPGRV